MPSEGSPAPGRHSRRVTEVVVLTTAMLTFISFWRAGAIVLCDLASTAWYIGGIAERAIGKSSPWFILAVMAFSACMLAVYVEASSMFVRGGVYKVVKESMGGTLAKVSVSALMFDYVLTGAISSVSAGQYLAGLANASFPALRIGWRVHPDAFSVAFAVAVTLYFWRQNIRGIEESSEKAVRIIQLVSLLAIVLFSWSLYTLCSRPIELPPFSLSFGPESLGWLEGSEWMRRIGVFGVLVGLGHAFLGMSGIESLAQVYREMEAPKLKNLKCTAVFVFLFAFCLTTASTFLAVMIIPDGVRARYMDNLLSGLAMSLAGPHRWLLVLQAFVVAAGALILSGAVNTSIVGANGVLNRLAEDGVMADWFRWLHPRHGTTHRMINLVVGFQLFTILACRGDVYLLGEAYAFGVIWSFMFMVASLILLRFQDRSPREWMTPINVRAWNIQLPVGLSLIFLVLVSVALVNLFTKKVATIWGLAFTALLYAVFHFSERLNRRRAQARSERREKLNLRYQDELRAVLGDAGHPRRVLVAMRDPKNMYPLEQTLESLDKNTTDVIVLHSKRARGLHLTGEMTGMGPEEELLFSNVIALAEKHGKSVIPLMVISNDPSYAIAQAGHNLGAEEIVMAASSKLPAEMQVESLAMTWGAIGRGLAHPVKVRILKPGGVKTEFDLT